MAEIDGNTVPAVHPSGLHRPPRTTPSELLPLSFRLSGLLFTLFLISGFPAIGNLRQELANFFYFLLSPKMNGYAATGR